MVKVKKVEQVKSSIKKTVNSNPIKKKKTFRNNQKASRRPRPKPLIIKKKDKGVVYLSHIPHGFYDEQIEGFFSQFGKVTQVSVPKSKSGRAKGYAFIEFEYPEVAKIAADSMNNYLMFNRLLKAKYLPPKDQKPGLFKMAQANMKHNQTVPERAVLSVKNNRKIKNVMLLTSQEARIINKQQQKVAEITKTMEKLGVTYEVQVEDGNSKSVLTRMENLVVKRKLQKKLREEAKQNKNNEDLSSFSDGENLPSAASSDVNFPFSKHKSSLSGNVIKTEVQESKASKTVISKSAEPVATPFVINPSKLKHTIKPSRGGKNKSQEKNKSLPVPSFKLQEQKQHSVKSSKSSKKKELPSKTVQKKPKDFLKKESTVTKLLTNNIKGKHEQRKDLGPKLLLPYQKSPLKRALKVSKTNMLEALKENTFKPTRSKKLKHSEPVKEITQSPKIKATKIKSQTPSKKLPKQALISEITVGTPKKFDTFKKSESVAKSVRKRKANTM